MPPKQNKKQAEKQAKKVVEDKTFGLKNKNKSAKVAKYVQQVEQNARQNQKNRQTDGRPAGPSKKELEAQKKAELAELFKPVQAQQKVPFGTDPKTVLCIFFKSGQCQKGAKCKFSHDINIERKSAKIDVYSDKRDENDTMDKWDQDMLEKVILSKHGNPRTTTDIVCKYFLEAIEQGKYGWFWICPNGGDSCKYRHALPPGYVLKKKEDKAKDDEEEGISLEEFLETERHKLGSNLTPINLETFTAWKKKRLAAAAAEAAKKASEKEAAARAGRKQGLSGRDLFTYHVQEDEEDEEEGDEFDLATYMRQNQEADDAAQRQAEEQARAQNSTASASNDNVDESLFEGEDLEQLQLEDIDPES